MTIADYLFGFIRKFLTKEGKPQNFYWQAVDKAD